MLIIFHVNLNGWLGLYQVNQQQNNKYNDLLTSCIHTRIHNGQSLKYNRLSKSSEKIHKKPLFDSNTNRKASSWCLLRLSNLKTSHTSLDSSPAIFNTRLPELHARFLCVTFSDMQGEMWLVHKSLRHGKRSRGSSSQTLFSAEPVTAGNTSAFAG